MRRQRVIVKAGFAALVVAFALILPTYSAFGDPPAFRLTNFRPFPPQGDSERGVISAGKAYIRASEDYGTSSIYEINVADGKISRKFPYGLLEQVHDEFLVDGLDGHLYYFNPLTEQKRLLPNDNLLYPISWLKIPFQNDVFYTSIAVSEDGRRSFVRVDLRTGSVKDYKLDGNPYAIAPDKMHMLVDMQGGLAIWDLAQYKPVTFSQATPPGVSLMVYFISNEFFVVPGTDSSTLEVWNIDGMTRELIPIELGDGWLRKFIWFSDDLKTAFAEMWRTDSSGNSVRRAGFLDSSSLGVYLAQHFRFHEKTGVLNDSNARVREFPNLDARVLGTLQKGSKVVVVDRSSLKVQIGALNDYWYSIKTPTDIEGWLYGAYVDLAKDASP
jgi:hypothetical protein